MVQTNPKITKKLMKEGGSRKTKSGMDKGDKKDNLTRTWSRDPMLAWNSPFSNGLALDQTIAGELAKLVFSCCRSRPSFLGSPHGHELLVLDHGKRRLLIHEGCLGLARGLLLTHVLTEAKKQLGEEKAWTTALRRRRQWRRWRCKG